MTTMSFVPPAPTVVNDDVAVLLLVFGSFDAEVFAVPVIAVPAAVPATTLNTGENVVLAPAATVEFAVQLMDPDVALTAGVEQVQPEGVVNDW